jgi:hypothetical protein
MCRSIRVLAMDKVEQIAEQLGDGVATGHGTRTAEILLRACRQRRGFLVHDPAGFSHQVLAAVFDDEKFKERAGKDRTRGRNAWRSQPWEFVIFAFNTNAEPGVAIAEDGDGLFLAFV